MVLKYPAVAQKVALASGAIAPVTSLGHNASPKLSTASLDAFQLMLKGHPPSNLTTTADPAGLATDGKMKHMANPLATVDQLYQRKRLDTLPQELQDVILFTCQCITQAAGVLLRLPQAVTAQANVILARYWLAEEPLAHEFSVR
jgi:hypothetical protein